MESNLSYGVTTVADTLWSVHAWHIKTPICWESAMQRNSLTKKTRICWESSMQMSSLKKSTDTKITCIYAHKIHHCLWEKSQAESNMQTLSLSLSKEREDQSQKKPRQKRDSYFRYCATMWNTAETVLGLWTSSMYTPTKLTNRIYKKWSNFRIMGTHP